MPNDWEKNPMEVDTAENNTGVYFVDYFEWHPNAADDDLSIADAAGNVLMKVRAIYGSPNSEESGIVKSERFCRPVYGINVSVIDGGTLYIHVR